MRRLFVLRHAKANKLANTPEAINSKEGEDFYRSLDAQGRGDAALVGNFLKQSYNAPEIVLVSPAFRTKETAEVVLQSAGWNCAVEFRPRLYLATAGQIFEELHKLDSSVQNAMIIGHNDGLQDFAVKLADDHDSDLWARLCYKLPTAGLAVFDVSSAQSGVTQSAGAQSGWASLQPESAKLTGLYFPE
jgi:phosphohistidine phosphatase